MGDLAVAYDDFSGGEFGTLGSRRAGRRRQGMFTARNMRVYKDGSIGPRPGIKNMDLSSVPSGRVWGLGFSPTTNGHVWFIVGTTAYKVQVGFQNTVAAFGAGSLASTPTVFIRGKESVRLINNAAFITSKGDKCYYLNFTTNTVQALTGSPGGRDIELYGDRMVVGGTTSEPYRLWFSDAADFATWDVANYIDIGYDWALYHLLSQRNALTIMAQSLHHRVTGALSSPVARLASGALPAIQFASVLDGDTIIYCPQVRSAPVTFDGVADEDTLAHLEWQSTLGTKMGTYSYENRDVLFVSGSGDARALLRSNGVWTVHDLGITVHAEGACTRFGSDKLLLLNNDGASGTATDFYSFDMSLQRPGFTGDTYASPGDGSFTPLTTYLHLPEFWHPEGMEMLVRGVVVDFVKWRTGSSTDNNFDVAVRALDRYQAVSYNASATQTWSEAGTSATTTGTEQRQVFGFGDQGSGGGFEIHLDNIKGVSIRSIVPIIDVLPSRAP